MQKHPLRMGNEWTRGPFCMQALCLKVINNSNNDNNNTDTDSNNTNT